MNRNPIIGIISIAFGIFCIGFLFICDFNNLIYRSSEIVFLRYFGPLLLINGGIYSVFLGIMFCLGRFVPYYKADKHEKAKLNFWGGLVGSPIIISIGLIAILHKALLMNLLGLCLLGFYFYFIVSGYLIINRYKDT
jgi:hypothetical protein